VVTLCPSHIFHCLRLDGLQYVPAGDGEPESVYEQRTCSVCRGSFSQHATEIKLLTLRYICERDGLDLETAVEIDNAAHKREQERSKRYAATLWQRQVYADLLDADPDADMHAIERHAIRHGRTLARWEAA
jgi:hypothetical protein